jgi:hypothetical protein
MMTRKELTGRLHHLADKMDRYRGPLTVTIPSTTLRAWIIEMRRLEAAIHALPDMKVADW